MSSSQSRSTFIISRDRTRILLHIACLTHPLNTVVVNCLFSFFHYSKYGDFNSQRVSSIFFIQKPDYSAVHCCDFLSLFSITQNVLNYNFNKGQSKYLGKSHYFLGNETNQTTEKGF